MREKDDEDAMVIEQQQVRDRHEHTRQALQQKVGHYHKKSLYH